MNFSGLDSQKLLLLSLARCACVKATEMIKFSHYKEAGGKKTVLAKGNNRDNWTLRRDFGGRRSLAVARSAVKLEPG